MTYPPTVPPNDRANGTSTFNNHASDHNTLADAVTDVINELGSNPKGSSPDLTARIAALVPPGVMFPWAGITSPPTGYLTCNGAAVSRSTYAALYAAVGTTYGAGDGSTTFNLPDVQGRMLVGKKSTGALSTLGEEGGSRDAVVVTHTHTDTFAVEDESGEHGHTVVNARNVWTQKGTGTADGMGVTPSVANAAGFDPTPLDPTTGTHTHPLTGSVTAAGVSGAEANMPPYLVVRYIVKT